LLLTLLKVLRKRDLKTRNPTSVLIVIKFKTIQLFLITPTITVFITAIDPLTRHLGSNNVVSG
jgi:hypothetical protein